MKQLLIEAAKSALVALARYLQESGEDPQAVFNAHLDANTIIAEAAERAKFG